MTASGKRLWAILLALPAMAAWGDGQTADAQFFGELPVVLSASRLAQRIDEAPAAVTVIDRETLVASGARQIADVFRLVPGMVVGRRNGYSPILGFHGFGDSFFRQFQVLVDGVSVYSPLYGGVEWGQLPFAIDDVERIEVVRGPNAATFGANSFLGVVNIITRDPATDPSVQVTANRGDDGIADLAVRFARRAGDWRYRLSAGQRSDRGLESLPDTHRSSYFNWRGHYQIAPGDELQAQLGYAGGYGEDGQFGSGETNSPRPANFETHSLQLRWTQARGPDDELRIQFAHAERRHREVLPYTLLGTWDYPLSFDYDHRRTDLELQRTVRLREDLRGVWGLQARQDGARSPTYFHRLDWLNSRLLRLFGNLEWRPAPGWLLHAGAMYEHNSITGAALSPSLALVHHLRPNHTLRLRMAKARRTPTLFEEHGDWRYDAPAGLLASLPPALRSLPLAQSGRTVAALSDEHILSRELGYLGDFADWRLNVELRLFHDQVRDLIGQYRYPVQTILGLYDADYQEALGLRNESQASAHGAALDLRWQPWLGAQVNLSGSRTTVMTDSASLAKAAPKHTASLLFRQALPADTSVALGYYRVSRMAWRGGGDIPPFDRLDLRLAKRFRWGGQTAEIAWVTQNILGTSPLFEPAYRDKRVSWLHIRYEY